MTGKEIYKIWAPGGVKWSDWVKPAPFIEIYKFQTSTIKLNISPIHYLQDVQPNTAVILDLPGYEGIREGIALAKIGYRPVPLYNGTREQYGALALVDNRPIENALIWGAAVLAEISLPDDAPPAFLLDSNRLHKHKMDKSMFDNSWDVYEQDLPTAEYFSKNNIDTVIVYGKKINKDLARVLVKFKKKGIKILLTDGYCEPREAKVRKPIR